MLGDFGRAAVGPGLPMVVPSPSRDRLSRLPASNGYVTPGPPE